MLSLRCELRFLLTRLTDNPLQTAVLNLFVNMKARFPNLVVGMITRESVRRALANGIMAEQVRTPYKHPIPSSTASRRHARRRALNDRLPNIASQGARPRPAASSFMFLVLHVSQRSRIPDLFVCIHSVCDHFPQSRVVTSANR